VGVAEGPVAASESGGVREAEAVEQIGGIPRIGEERAIPEVVDGGGGSREDGVEEADGLGPVAGAAEARELGALGGHGGGARSPAAGAVGKRTKQQEVGRMCDLGLCLSSGLFAFYAQVPRCFRFSIAPLLLCCNLLVLFCCLAPGITEKLLTLPS
jgi:hypothetical protein